VTLRKYAVLIWAFLLATAAIAGEEHRTRIDIDIDDEAGQSSFVFDSEDAGFDLDDMAVGERRTLTDDSGNVADVLRTEQGFELDGDKHAHRRHEVRVIRKEVDVTN